MGFLGVLQELRKQSCQLYAQGSERRADKQLVICPHKLEPDGIQGSFRDMEVPVEAAVDRV